jgi:hypothetical protein
MGGSFLIYAFLITSAFSGTQTRGLMYLNFAVFVKELLPVVVLRFYPAFCSRDMGIYLLYSALASRRKCGG